MPADVALHLYDSLSRTVRAVEPRDPGRFGCYSCGPTVYAPIHVGNARPYVIALVLRNHLRASGIDARVVCNITDVNERIDAKARELGISSRELADAMTDRYVADTDRLGIGRPDAEPRVTGSMPEIIDLVSRLIDRGLAYAAEGDVYFSVSAFPGYGRLSGQRVAELLAEGRVEAGEGKRAPADFALWKARKADEDSWSTPWGEGRPGWHIECSAMARAHLGEDFDVHGGGLDLIFPHHENERAQTEGATGGRFCRTWLHNGMLRFGGDKMSKSLGNVEALSDAIDAHGAETILMLFARGHYRSPLEYTDASMDEAARACDRFREALRAVDRALGDPGDADGQQAGGTARRTDVAGSGGSPLAEAAAAAATAFDAALDDDLATQVALAALYELVRAANAGLGDGSATPVGLEAARETLVSRLGVLGLAGLAGDGAEASVPAEVRGWAEERLAARSARDFARADELRTRIAEAGFEARDTADGYELTRAR
jgi:cysteinyl-tRNA synthetase